METKQAIVVRIRPVSWKVFVTGVEGVEHVRKALCQAGMDCSLPIPEPELQKEPIVSLIATTRSDSSLTAEELQAIFDHDDNIEVAFDI